MRPIPVDETLPVLATDPRWTTDGVELALEKSILKVGDDGGRLRTVLDACDGSRRVRTGTVVCTLLLFVDA